jgi:hypothetical protein
MKRLLQLMSLLALLLGVTWALRASAPEWAVSWWTVDGGGGTSSGGDYALTGTAGQAEVGAWMQGGAYELAGGFWGAGGQPEYDLYLPVVLRSYPQP